MTDMCVIYNFPYVMPSIPAAAHRRSLMSGISSEIGRPSVAMPGQPSPGDPVSMDINGAEAAAGHSVHPAVTVVVPGRNCAETLRHCLASLAPLCVSGQLAEVLFVDDGSTDESSCIANECPSVRVLNVNRCGGPGAARNRGWRAARTEFVWFVDADCVPQPDALSLLLVHFSDPGVAGVGGSYTNLRLSSWLARVIQGEIAARHRRMNVRVDFVASFNIVYMRSALEQVGGFDETDVNGPMCPGAEDCELAFRLRRAGYELRFEQRSCVGHYHPDRVRQYLRRQMWHAHWRVRLYRLHPRRIVGDDYSQLTDHLQPALALATLGAVPFAGWRIGLWTLAASGTLLVVSQAPLAFRIVRGSGIGTGLAFVVVGCLRAVAHSLGAISGVVSCIVRPPCRDRGMLPVARDEIPCRSAGTDRGD